MKFRLGINYWPITSAMYWWQRFDYEEVKRDFARIRHAGFDSVRIFLLWEDFQPSPDRVSDRSLANLVRTADCAAINDLSLMPTLFTGHMSGVNWLPEWAIEPQPSDSRFRIVSGGKVVRAKPRNWYGDPAVLSAQLLLAREVASALGKHPALWAFDLGNENSNCVVPPSRASAVRWLDAVVGEIRAIDSSHQVTIGLHMEDLEEDRNLGPKEAARVCDFLCMHGYPIYADWAESRHDALILPFLGLITGWLGGREVLFEEFGAPAVSGAQINANSGVAKLFSEEETASFMRDALEALHRFGFLGAMWWCYGDYAKWLWSWPPLDLAEHERYFGLWRSDYSAGPAVAEAGRFRNVERGRRPDDLSWIDIEPTRFYEDPRGHLGSLYHKFRLAQLH